VAANAIDAIMSPFWWMRTLTARKVERLPRLEKLQAWLDNTPPLPPGAPEWEEAFQAFHASSRTNLADLTVESARERMNKLGLRTAATDDRDGDKAAADIMAENELALRQNDLYSDMLGLSVGYTMVGPPQAGSEVATVTVESPWDVITAQDPLRPSQTRAAIKSYFDPDRELDVVWLHFAPGSLNVDTSTAVSIRATRKVTGSRKSIVNSRRFRIDPKDWTWDKQVDLPITRNPVTMIENSKGVADFERHLDMLERMNRQTLQRLLIMELQAFRQRAIEGLPSHWPDDYAVEAMRGKPIDYEGIFTPGPGSLWQVPPGVKFWESQPIDVRPILDAESRDQRTYAALVRIPLSYFNPDDANGSAEGASLQREGLVYRVEDRQVIAENGWKHTYSKSFEMVGDTERAKMAGLSVIWSPVERLSLSERYSAASQAQAVLPRKTIQREVLGFTPQQMQMAEEDAAADFLFNQRPAGEAVPSQRTVPITGAPATPPVSV
jgi:hypothetical protein